MRDTKVHELRFTTTGAWEAAFDRLYAHPQTRLCVARRRDLTLHVRTADPATLLQDGRILETPLPEAV